MHQDNKRKGTKECLYHRFWSRKILQMRWDRRLKSTKVSPYRIRTGPRGFTVDLGSSKRPCPPFLSRLNLFVHPANIKFDGSVCVLSSLSNIIVQSTNIGHRNVASEALEMRQNSRQALKSHMSQASGVEFVSAANAQGWSHPQRLRPQLEKK